MKTPKRKTQAALLPPDLLGMMDRGVSVIVSSCNAALRPSIMRAVCSQLAPGGQTITVYLSRLQSRQLLQDIRDTGRIAVVFSEPASHRTVQVKAGSARIRDAQPSDEPALQRYLASMEKEIRQVGFNPTFTQAMLAGRLPDLVAISFEPEQAFDQTPGPKAGAALGGARRSAAMSIAGPLPRCEGPLGGQRSTRSVLEERRSHKRGGSCIAAGPQQAPSLADIRPCLEGAIPAVMATCARDGTPNVAYISQVFYVDARHVALSFQFFNKTRQNILSNPLSTVLVLHPVTAAFYRLHIRYLRTETEGPLFEGMKAQLAGIASHSGMAAVFRLLGSDIHEVLEIEAIAGEPLPSPPPRAGMLTALRLGSERLSRCTALDELLNAALATLTGLVGNHHAMVLMLDPATQRLYTVASSGYATSGVGSEIEMGDGVIGVAARERTPVRIMHMTNAYLYSRAIRGSMYSETPGLTLDTDIPYPGLPEPHSQVAVPMVSAGRLLGVLFAESPNDMQFGFEDEDMLVTLAGHLGAAIDVLQGAAEPFEPTEPVPGATPARKQRGTALQLKRFKANDSVFVNDTYLIKGVAGAIFWKLANDYVEQGRTEFSNRELRLDPSIRLPDVTDNLEARLLLLQRRLAEYGPHIRIEKTGRGRFRLAVQRPLELTDVAV